METPTDAHQRWRLVLGTQPPGSAPVLDGDLAEMDQVLSDLYGADAHAPRRGGMGASAPKVNRWLGDIRKYFPSTVVAVMQKDAMTRLGLHQMLLEPEVLRTVQADVHLVGTLMSLNRVMPAKVKDTAREVVAKVVRELMQRLEHPLRQAVTGSLSRAVRNPRPRLREIDWPQTIRANLKHYQPTYKTIIPERLIGYGRKGQALKHVVLCVDQSGSMAGSVVYSSIMGAVMASIPALNTRMIVFDTAVADLSENLRDPVDLLFGVQLGGGTDINLALSYCQQSISVPAETTLVLITDLFEGGNEVEMLKRAAALKVSGVNLIVLLALSDEGKPIYSHETAAKLAALDVPSFACTPDQFPSLMAAALQKRDLNQWLDGVNRGE